MPQWGAVFQSFHNPSNLAYLQSATLRDDGEGAYLGVNYKGFSLMSSYTAVEDASFVRGIVGDVRSKRGFGDLGYSLKAAPKWEMTFNLDYTRTELDAPEYPEAHRDANEADFEWTNFVTFSERDRLTFGTVINRIRGTELYYGEQPTLVDEDAQRWGAGFYIQHEHRLTGDLKLIGGLQANKIGSIALNVVPRAGILWNPAAHFTIKALYGGAFRAPSLDETGLNHPGLKGDPNLVPEKVGTLDLQVVYQGNRVQASLDYFHSRETQLIFEDGSTHPARTVAADVGGVSERAGTGRGSWQRPGVARIAHAGQRDWRSTRGSTRGGSHEARPVHWIKGKATGGLRRGTAGSPCRRWSAAFARRSKTPPDMRLPRVCWWAPRTSAVSGTQHRQAAIRPRTPGARPRSALQSGPMPPKRKRHTSP